MADLYPTKLTISDLYCYRGEHTIDLGPTVYAVGAEADDNPNRSNWLGKSTLLMAFAFALVGWHTKKTDDEIVTIGATEAKVELWLNDGAKITRSKRLGKSVQVSFTPPGGKPCTQDKAIAEIARHTGIDADNFFEVLFFRQGKMNEFVTAGAASRVELVEGWLRQELEPVQRMFSAASGHFVTVKRAHEDAVRARDQAGAEIEEIALKHLSEVVPDIGAALAQNAEQLAEEVRELQLQVKAAAAGEAKVERWHDLKAKAAEYEQIVEAGLARKEELEAIDGDAESKFTEAKAEKLALYKEAEAARTKYQALRKSEFTFDGNCPVACDVCPSAAWVNEHATSAQALKAAREVNENKARDYEQAHREVRELEKVIQERASIENQIVTLRAKATELLPYVDLADALEEEPPAEGEYAELSERLSEAHERLVLATQAIERHSELVAIYDAALLAVEENLRQVQIASDALAIVGKGGVQRAIQELMLTGVEADANAMLAANSIDLRIQVVWDQESKGLAKVCGTCGMAFPTSQRIKVCDACGAERGPNVSQKLRFQLSNVSGAAEDLAGFALGLAAGRWLRAHRGVKLSTVWIDEPFGKLDPHHRKALGNSIAGMLSQTFQSAYVVAHELATLYALPGRITIKAGPTGSRLHDVG